MIRVNSQSGKGGVAWVLQQDKGLKLPKKLQAHFSRTVQALADETSRELNAADIWQAFQSAYRLGDEKRFKLVDYEEKRAPTGERVFTGKIMDGSDERTVSGRGNGIISSVLAALADSFDVSLEVVNYSEHAIGAGSDANAAAYVECRDAAGETVWGVGIDEDVATASVRAVLSAASNAAD